MRQVEDFGVQLAAVLESNLKFLGLPSEVDMLIISLCLVGLVLTFSTIAYWLFKKTLFKYVDRISEKHNIATIKLAKKHNLLGVASWLVPAFAIYMVIPVIDIVKTPYSAYLYLFFQRVTSIMMIILGAVGLSNLLNLFEEKYRTYSISKVHPIKSYLQVLKIAIIVITAILSVSVLINKSPAYLLTGLGALTAMVMLVFKDSILGFVASIQLTMNDMVRIGDWIEVPNYGANGDVVDISLNTIKVQNFDKTIVTVPSYSLLNTGVINWRGMNEAGGRRIKRSIHIDIKSIHFCDSGLMEKLENIEEIADFVASHKSNVSTDKAEGSRVTYKNKLTNIKLYREYIKGYLSRHPKVHDKYTFLIRELQPTATGLPVEIYIFLNDTNWINYEEIQADIFDHLYGILPIFDLKIFQYYSGESIAALA